jgi:REP element-mobilizing transposase RayT
VTFRTYDSVDVYVKNIQNSTDTEKIKQYKIDQYLDKSQNGAYFYDDVIDIMIDTILIEDENMYDVEIMAIMPNHVHILLKQNTNLDKIMKYIKGKSAVEVNKYLKKEGKFWADGYFDKAIRDEEHFTTVYNYIKNNALKAGLTDERVFSKYE